MLIVRFTAIVSLLALMATPTYAAHRRHHARTVNGATSVKAPNGGAKATRSGGPAGGQTTN